jgi:TRAP-type C4-dicarboxylate transport system substrate-binding protein
MTRLEVLLARGLEPPMNADKRRRLAEALVMITLPSMLVSFSGDARPHPHGEQWALANEYPATSLPGEGDAYFARLVGERTQGRLSIVALPDARLGYKSREQLKAVAEGKVAMADSFGGALGDEHPIFALASLPFIVGDAAQARALLDAARPAYEAAFAKHNQKLLYCTPWPPSGLWAKAGVTTPEAVAKLHLRTYDQTGTDLFARLGASASVVSFADLAAKLASGEIDAVLSSGDGGAGRKLWEHLPMFTEINYGIPLSFTTVNLDRWNALEPQTRRAVEAAAAETEARQWRALEGRLALNYERMRQNGMTIVTDISPELRSRLREAGKIAAQEWAAKAGAEGAALLERNAGEARMKGR